MESGVPEISTAWSLGVIAAILMITTVASLIKSRRDPGTRAHAGAVVGAEPAAAQAERTRTADREREPSGTRPG